MVRWATAVGRAGSMLGCRRWLLAVLACAMALSLSSGVAGAAEVEKAVGHPATASTTKGAGYEPAKALDQNSTTRWSSQFGVDNQWWQVDLGSVTKVSRVTVDWYTSYATRYLISTSTDGTTFTQVADVTNSAAGLKSTSFTAVDARYVRITGVTRAVAQYGISFWEARVYGDDGSAPPPPGEVEKAVGRTATSSTLKGAGYEPAKALDQDSTTRWSSQFGVDNQWWQVDLGSVRKVSRVTVDWFSSYATRYLISVSSDGSAFTQVADVTNTSSGLKSASFTETTARYVRITGVTRSIAQYGISFWEARVYGAADGSPPPPPPPPPPGETPWTSAISLPGTIQAEEYNKGGEGVAYHDFDTTNVGGAFRPTEGVDVGATGDTGGGYNVGWIRAGEWLDYTVTVPAGGQYDIGLRWASGTTGGKAHVSFGGTNVSGTINLGSTGGWQSWSTIWASGVSLPAGTSVLRFVVDSSNGSSEIGNLNSIIVRNAVVPVTPKWPSSWSAKASSPTPRFEQFATVVGSRIFVFGGWNPNFKVVRSYASYNTATDTWTQLGDLPAGMAETHVGITNDGSRYIYTAGGFGGDLDTTKNPTQWTSDWVMRYDTQNNTWTQITTLPALRGAGALQLVNGKLHYFGGNPPDRVSNVGDHYVYDIASDKWTTATPMPNPKDHFSTAVIGSKIYAIGGEYGHDTSHLQQPTAAVYETSNDTWTTLANMPIAKSHTEAGTYVSGGTIVMAGGQVDNFQPTSNVISYDPAVDAWATLAPLPYQRQGAVIQQIGNQVFLTLGGIQTNQPQSGTWAGQLP